ncbi:hypothetical protein I3843_09G081900 [Carya illinoinensis]|nr:hypothetical protein I3843_09G081900 [Carya illinoinensis]
MFEFYFIVFRFMLLCGFIVFDFNFIRNNISRVFVLNKFEFYFILFRFMLLYGLIATVLFLYHFRFRQYLYFHSAIYSLYFSCLLFILIFCKLRFSFYYSAIYSLYFSWLTFILFSVCSSFYFYR